jgi:hypothetical protein
MDTSLLLILLLFFDYCKRRFSLSLNLETNLVHHVYCKPVIQTISFCKLALKNKLEFRNNISSMGIPILVWKNVFGSLEGTFKFL